MKLAKNTPWDYLKKGLLLLVGLASLIAPYSNKFYFFANRQIFRSVTTNVNADHCSLFAAGQRDYQKCRVLSMDKRYNHQHAFGLDSPFLIAITSPKSGKQEDLVPTDPKILHLVFSSYLRGPPCIIFSTIFN